MQRESLIFQVMSRCSAFAILFVISVHLAMVASGYKKFLMVMNSRVGSHWLESMLNNHPDVHCASELFVSGDTKHCSAFYPCLEKAWSLSDKPIRGFRVAPFLIPEPQSNYMASFANQMPIIYLRRRRIIDSILSIERAIFLTAHCPLNGWAVKKDQVSSCNTTGISLRINPPGFLARIQTRIELDRMHDEWVAMASNKVLYLYYEDMVENPERNLRKALAFLGADPALASTRSHYVRTKTLELPISNLQQLRIIATRLNMTL